MKAMINRLRKCDICDQPLLKEDTFFDFRPGAGADADHLPGGIAWAWGCYTCFQACDGVLGTGKGQEYDSMTLEKLGG